MILKFKTQSHCIGAHPSYYMSKVTHASNYVRFPFRIVYAALRGDEAQALVRSLQYALTFDVTPELVKTLAHLSPEFIEDFSDGRRPDKPGTSAGTVIDVLDDSYIFIVPLYPDRAKSEYKDKRSVTRVFRREIWNTRYHPLPLPRIALATATRTVPSMCTLCLNVLSMQSGECSPGDHSCRTNMCILLKEDKDV